MIQSRSLKTGAVSVETREQNWFAAKDPLGFEVHKVPSPC